MSVLRIYISVSVLANGWKIHEFVLKRHKSKLGNLGGNRCQFRTGRPPIGGQNDAPAAHANTPLWQFTPRRPTHAPNRLVSDPWREARIYGRWMKCCARDAVVTNAGRFNNMLVWDALKWAGGSSLHRRPPTERNDFIRRPTFLQASGYGRHI